ncbi:MAG: hypothetical protein NVS1B11_36700 [Terriglobales bacterium]
MQASAELVEAIKKFEGFRAKPYQDLGGVWTVGYGSTIRVEPNEVISPGHAELVLRAELADATVSVLKHVERDLKQNQFDALLDFTFNCGEGSLMRSTLLKFLNAGNLAGTASEFERWVHVKSHAEPVRDLIVRRKAEQCWFTGSHCVLYPTMQQQHAWLADLVTA